MKRIGIIGGIGPESTIEYYRLIIKKFREQLETKHYPELFIQSIDMTAMLDFVFNNRLDELVEFLKKKIQQFEKLDVDYVVLASNTPHLVFDQLASSVKIEMISIVEESCKVISKMGLQKVGLLGTKSTMSMGFYQAIGKKYNIEILTPTSKQQDYVHEKYMDELVFNQVISETKEQLIQIVQELKSQQSIQGIILGGTELPLALSQSDFNYLKVFNTTEIHVEAILEKMIGQEK